MNIFALDADPRIAAQHHFDKHVVKMILEYSQLLSAAHHMTDSPYADQCYKLTHKHHPSSLWTRASADNYRWLYRLFMELCREYSLRYNRQHLTEQKMADVLRNVPPALPESGLLPVFLAMPDKESIRNETFGDSVAAYRAYYRTKPIKLHTWRIRDVPEFMEAA